MDCRERREKKRQRRLVVHELKWPWRVLPDAKVDRHHNAASHAGLDVHSKLDAKQSLKIEFKYFYDSIDHYHQSALYML